MSSAVCLFILHHPEKEKGFLVGTKSSGPAANSIIRSPSLDRVLWHAAVPDADADACVPARRFPGVSLLRYSSASCMTSHNPAAGVASTKHPVAPLVPAWGGLRRHASLIPCQSAGPTVWDIQASSVQCISACVVLRAAGVGAGHGSQVPDQSGDETDGLNETLCPCDFKHVRIPLLPFAFRGLTACLLRGHCQPCSAYAAMHRSPTCESNASAKISLRLSECRKALRSSPSKHLACLSQRVFMSVASVSPLTAVRASTRAELPAGRDDCGRRAQPAPGEPAGPGGEAARRHRRVPLGDRPRPGVPLQSEEQRAALENGVCAAAASVQGEGCGAASCQYWMQPQTQDTVA